MADITRAELSTLIQEEYSNELLSAAMDASVALQAFRTVNMGTKTTNLPVLATIPEAGFVAESPTDPTGVKPTAQTTWGNKQLVAEEIAVIIPVHEDAIDDASVDVLDEIAKHGGAAIGRKLDAAVLFGDDKPASWVSDDLLAAAVGASQTVTVGAGDDDLGGAILQAAGMVDEAGYDPAAALAPRGLRFRLANLRDDENAPIFLPSLSNAPGARDNLFGLDAHFVSSRVWDRDEAELFVVDPDQVVIGVRQDITVKLLDQATLTNGEGTINLAERDMVALRFKARYAYVLADVTNSEGEDQVPVAAVLPTGS